MNPRILPAAPGAVPILVWARALPPGAEKQLRHLAAQPYVVEHVAAMPDVHVAHGVAVGSVFATEHHVVPGALGGDLGCGVSAYRFAYPAASLGRDTLELLLTRLSQVIPVGDATHRGRGLPLPSALEAPPLSTQKLRHAWERLAPRHLGTLGGGNHFLELDRDAGGDLWLLLHSGSRGVGAAIGEHHQRVAKTLGEGSLPGLSLHTPEGAACLADLDLACRFARANRDALAARALEVLSQTLGISPEPESTVDLHHNHVAGETHFGRALWVHRKGAVGLESGRQGLIPGSMGTASYVVEGRAEPRAFRSCSHGAGRVLTRTEARARIRPSALEHALRRVVHDSRRAAALVEEAPAAYRDIVEVLEDEADLVTPVRRLTPIAVLKG
ncbi:RtcB family protein [Myxococcus llanfairpwllgwyngyllgogerychwyrndrobwllllantysiliogogogochensis]|uniref:3'-phosphate/5'-hydroxy nucleic acid ligase n=1 Tax=Myxococcus llanfairpwllgwyngyllgogerychwyrndrobwllllantysiliogogogochensis TaxID=2590453 RepID=A0A540X7B0_9BACT|nr:MULTISPECIES: RtcB family protein [Myxococcus]NTX37584.1 RtcB family protein [Myxococcus sp. CA033]TQF17155.1 RtcB family protein [Myxococcus llanfairpwllgwyngyllgogerychwyrndrobwllllantysiliogogogochensis]